MNSGSSEAVEKTEIPERGTVGDLQITSIGLSNLEDQSASGECSHGFGELVGASSRMRELFQVIKKVAPLDATVLISGETGTGKDLVARAIHGNSERFFRDFVPINCGSLPDNLLESELFGHVKGAYTGAHRRKCGLLELADHGTIFLDEVGEANSNFQVKLLRVIENKEIIAVGDTKPRKINTRFIFATNCELKEAVAEGRFRQDLFYRIGVFQIFVPPLRERREDILLLARHFMNRFSKKIGKPVKEFDASAQSELIGYNWPGNVRELENTVERVAIFSNGGSITGTEISEALNLTVPQFLSLVDLYKMDFKEATGSFEKLYLTNALIRTRGNISAAAKLMGISRPYLHRVIKKHNLKV